MRGEYLSTVGLYLQKRCVALLHLVAIVVVANLEHRGIHLIHPREQIGSEILSAPSAETPSPFHMPLDPRCGKESDRGISPDGT